MKQSEEVRDLLSRYAAEVGTHLPRSSREDIGKELPRWTAASYLKHGYVVGPELFLLFSMVCRIVLPIVFAVSIGAQTLALALGSAPAATVAGHILRILGSSVGGTLQAFAVVVIAFAIWERAGPAQKVRAVLDPWSPWDPRELPKSTEAASIPVSDQILTIVFGTIFLVFLVCLPRLLAEGVRNAGIAVVRLALSDGLLTDILVAVFLLTRRVQTGAFSEAELGIRVVNWILRGGCILGIVAGSFDLARGIIRFTRGRRAGA